MPKHVRSSLAPLAQAQQGDTCALADYIIVDAYGTTSDGPYSLTVSGAGCGTLVPVTL